MPRPTANWGRFQPALCLALVLVAWARMVTAATELSPVVDEQSHVSRGVSVWRTGDLRLTIGHPLLLHLWEALPLANDDRVVLPVDDPSWRRADRWDAFGEAFLWRAYGSPPQTEQPDSRPRANSTRADDGTREIRPPADGIVFRARAMIMLLALVLLALIFRWSADLAHPRAGFLALAMASFDPNLLAHGALATTDLGVSLFCFAATWALWRLHLAGLRGAGDESRRRGDAGRPAGDDYRPSSDRRPRWRPAFRHPAAARWTLIAGLLAGAALASKFSALVFVPVWLALAAWAGGIKPAISIVLAAAATVVLVYAGQVGSYVADLRWLLGAAEEHPAFLLGQLSVHGWWYYFPVTFILKTPLATLALMGGAALTGLRFRPTPLGAAPPNPVRRRPRRAAWITAAYLILPPLFYSLVSVASGFNVGYRHLMPILPFAWVATAWALAGPQTRALHATTGPLQAGITTRIHAHRLPPHSPVARSVIIAVAVLWLATSSLAAHPNYLSYFNGLALRPHDALVDSNLDWGQGLIQLARYLRSESRSKTPSDSPSAQAPRSAAPPYLSYFGPGDPEAYGIRYQPLPRWPMPRRNLLRPANPVPGRYIVGATNLQGLLLPQSDTFDWFRRRRPDASLAGGSLLVYEVRADPSPPKATTLCEAPWTPVMEADVATILGPLAAERIVRIDCRKAWLWPAGAAGAGWFVAPPEVFAARPPLAMAGRLDFLHTPDVKAGAYAVWRQPALTLGVPLPRMPHEGSPVAFHGNLKLLGTDLPLAGLRVTAGQTLTVMTAWGVTGPITLPVSIFGQLLQANGALLAGSDGFGAPIVALEAGDVLGIRHEFLVPADTPAGKVRFQTGFYRLDTGERFRSLPGPATEAVDAVMLGEIAVER